MKPSRANNIPEILLRYSGSISRILFFCAIKTSRSHEKGQRIFRGFCKLATLFQSCLDSISVSGSQSALRPFLQFNKAAGSDRVVELIRINISHCPIPLLWFLLIFQISSLIGDRAPNKIHFNFQIENLRCHCKWNKNKDM